jgi:lipopolysaccharide/colanic/teichoic acid biosynthesis glycosyltransferase
VSSQPVKPRTIVRSEFLKILISAGGATFLVGLDLFLMSGASAAQANLWVGLLGVGALHTLLVIVLERCLRAAGLSHAWRFRLPFWVSLGLGILQTVAGLAQPALVGAAPGASPSALFTAARLFVIFLGAFGGGLLATSLQETMIEMNFQPSAHLQAEVLAAHQPYPVVRGRQAGIKRAFDILLASLALLVSMPVWLFFAFLIWIEDPGPLLFVKNSVGLGGHNFRQFKFRSMISRAEQLTGPVLAEINDQRILRFGRLMRKTALDELPQLLNILQGEMSFVGPRPQRTVLVQEYLAHMPEYAARHAVRPGLAGLAQVVSHYYLTPRQKLRFDRVYIANMSLGFDLKLVGLAFALAFYFRWKKGWNGRIPRRLLRFGSGPRP